MYLYVCVYSLIRFGKGSGKEEGMAQCMGTSTRLGIDIDLSTSTMDVGSLGEGVLPA